MVASRLLAAIASKTRAYNADGAALRPPRPLMPSPVSGGS